jgi:bla regulator protein blaR1
MKRAMALIFAAGAAWGQSFEVASIKPSDPNARGSSTGIAPGGIFRARNVTLKSLIEQAYDVNDFELSGGPGWIGTQGYDIEAKGNGPAVSEEDLMKATEQERNRFRAQMQARLRALLAERFQLKLHRETKEMAVYALAVGKGGPKIQATTEDPGPQTGFSMSRNAQGKQEITATRQTMATLARLLWSTVGRPVIDKTGLAGNFNFKVAFATDLADPDGPSVFTAFEEQLGLKLDSQKGPVEVVVIDGVEKASEN